MTESAPTQSDWVERAVAGALRSAIAAHGPITTDTISSAAKRIIGVVTKGDRPADTEVVAIVRDLAAYGEQWTEGLDVLVRRAQEACSDG